MSKGLKVVSLAFIIIALTAFIIDAQSNEGSSELNNQPVMTFDEFDDIIATPVQLITAVELAEFLMKQQHHYNLINLEPKKQSSSQATEGYFIPTAEAHTYESFLKLNIPVNETIILYSRTEIEAIQLYYLLTIRGYFKVKVLKGGVNAWHQQVLYPLLSKIDFADQGYRKKLTTFFGGSVNNVSGTHSIEKVILDKKIKKHQGC